MGTRTSATPHTHARPLWLAAMVVMMAAILVIDTTSDYEVAVAVFYAVVILTAARILRGRALIWLAVACIGLTAVSFAITPRGDYHAGLINLAISLAAIVLMTWLLIKIEAAHAAAHLAQVQLLRLTRVQRLEGLTTAIAHEVNQPLTAIVTSGHACQRWLAQDPPNLGKARQALERMLNDAGRASQIVARVRSLSRGEPVQAVDFDFNQVVRDVVALSAPEMERHGIALLLELADDLPPAHADPVQIRQVIGNLLINAIEAMAATPAATHRLRLESGLKDGQIVFAIADSGSGIPATLEEHLFDAFWTTKPEGTGVGLSISRTMIEANGGQIWAEPAQPSGAVFRIRLPPARGERT